MCTAILTASVLLMALGGAIGIENVNPETRIGFIVFAACIGVFGLIAWVLVDEGQ